MPSRNSIAALVALATVSVATGAEAQKPAPVAPSWLLQQQQLELTPHQVRELSVLAAQVRRYQQAVLRAPSKPWIATTRGTTRAVASERALALLTPQQREMAMGITQDSLELAATTGQPSVLLD